MFNPAFDGRGQAAIDGSGSDDDDRSGLEDGAPLAWLSGDAGYECICRFGYFGVKYVYARTEPGSRF